MIAVTTGFVNPLFGKEAGWKTVLYMPILMALGVGISINNAKAVFEAIWSAGRSPSVSTVLDRLALRQPVVAA